LNSGYAEVSLGAFYWVEFLTYWRK
jgi:hypothetical protein